MAAASEQVSYEIGDNIYHHWGVVYGSVKPNNIGLILSALVESPVGVTLTLFLVLVHVAHA